MLVVVALALYANALANPFLSDDEMLIAANSTLSQPSVRGLAGLWTAAYWQGITPEGRVFWLTAEDQNLYRPVTIFSFWLNAWVAGGQPWGFRLGNVLLHAAAAWMVGLWAAGWCGSRVGLIASAVVLLHPVATDVVNRIVGRADELALLGTAAFLVVQDAAAKTSWTWRHAVAGVLTAAVALGAKESGAMVLPLALLQVWMRGWARRAAPALAVLAVVLAVYVAGRSAAVALPSYPGVMWDLTDNPLSGAGLRERLPASGALAWGYLVKLVWPWPLLAFELPERLPTWSDPEVWLGWSALVVMAVVAVWSALRRRVHALAVVWFLTSFAIVGQLIVPIGTYSEVRLAYPMLGGLALAVGWFGGAFCWKQSWLRTLGFPLLGIAGVLAASIVVGRNAESRSNLSLAEADVRYRPGNASALIRLALVQRSGGHLREAEAGLVRASALAPGSAQVWYELAELRAERGEHESARRLYERAGEINPSNPMMVLKAATTALEAGDLTAAERWLGRAERLDPEDPFTVYNLAVLDDARGNAGRARARLEALVKRRPDFTLAVRGLAALERSAREREGAVP